MALMPRLTVRPTVIGDERLALGECRMETELGMADLGLWSQLKEIEHGFFDAVGSAQQASGEPGGSAGKFMAGKDRAEREAASPANPAAAEDGGWAEPAGRDPDALELDREAS